MGGGGRERKRKILRGARYEKKLGEKLVQRGQSEGDRLRGAR